MHGLEFTPNGFMHGCMIVRHGMGLHIASRWHQAICSLGKHDTAMFQGTQMLRLTHDNVHYVAIHRSIRTLT